LLERLAPIRLVHNYRDQVHGSDSEYEHSTMTIQSWCFFYSGMPLCVTSLAGEENTSPHIVGRREIARYTEYLQLLDRSPEVK